MNILSPRTGVLHSIFFFGGVGGVFLAEASAYKATISKHPFTRHAGEAGGFYYSI